ncbi:MAG TPA: hypothetical protein VKR23_13525 [Gaiellaceae bacterium]|nr:hypothetical protein [Gaiellaceae bacterium]
MARWRFLSAASISVVAITLVSISIAGAATSRATHKLIVRVDKKVAVLVLISQNGGAPSGAVATPIKPLTVLLDNTGVYRVKAEIDSSCKGTCTASYRISGSANHKLAVVPSCARAGSSYVCSAMKIVRVD